MSFESRLLKNIDYPERKTFSRELISVNVSSGHFTGINFRGWGSFADFAGIDFWVSIAKTRAPRSLKKIILSFPGHDPKAR